MSIAPNPLNDISRIYLEQIAEKKDDSYLETDFKKRQANNEKARKEMAKVKDNTVPRWMREEEISEAPYQVYGSSDGKKTNKIGKPVKSKRYAQNRADELSDTHKGTGGKYYIQKEALDPVGREDADIDNDGDVDKSDKYLHKRRKAISKAMKKRMSEAKNVHGQIEVPQGDVRKLAKKASKRIDADVDGDVDNDDPKEKGMGEFIPSPDGKKKIRTSVHMEGFSNWREDLSEVMSDNEVDKKIKEKKVNNKIKINPEFKESVEELGGTLLEMVEIDEIDYIIEDVYTELQEEGYEDDDIEEALEYALTEAKITYGHDTESPRDKMMKQAKGRLKFLGRKVGEKIGAAKKAATFKSAQAQVAAYNKGREALQTASDKARKAKQTVADAPKKAKKGVKGFIKKQAEKVVKRMSEETVDEALRSREERMARMMTDKDRQKQKKERELKAKADEIISTERALGKGKENKSKTTYDTPSAEVRKLKPGQKKDILAMKARKAMEEYEIDEKLNLKTAEMGEVIKDFQKSDAPQFKGRTKEERRQMAIAAKLTAERGGKKLGEQQEEDGTDESKEKQMLAKKKQMLQKQYMLDKMRLQMQQQGKLPLGHRTEETEVIDERRREDKGKPKPAEPSAAFKAVSKMMGSSRLGVQPRGVKKEPGKKPPVAGELGAPISPAQKLSAKRAAAKRAQDMMTSRFD